MICDDLTQTEICEAYLIYASLHGYPINAEIVRAKVRDYVENNIPDPHVDDAILAYLDDAFVAPPDVVLSQWGSSRFYELREYDSGEARHQTCEVWFQNACRLPQKDCPALVHFWTNCLTVPPREFQCNSGARLQFELTSEPTVVHVVHRELGLLGQLPTQLAAELNAPLMRRRRFLPLVDRPSSDPGQQALVADEHEKAGTGTATRILVVTAEATVPIENLFEYASRAFHAKRTKC